MTAKFSEEKTAEMCKRYKEGESATKIAKDMGLYTTSVTRVLNRNGIETGHKKGKEHPNWKGGRIDKGDGYIGIWKPEHPRADNQGYVFEHTLVIEKELGKLPEDNEMVHHINCDKHDNRIENLYLCTRGQHKKAHWSLENLLPDLIERDIVGFDKKKGEYYLK